MTSISFESGFKQAFNQEKRNNYSYHLIYIKAMSASEETYLQENSCKFHAKVKKKNTNHPTNQPSTALLIFTSVISIFYLFQVSGQHRTYRASHTSIHCLYPGTKYNSYRTQICSLITSFPTGTHKAKYEVQHCVNTEVSSWFWALLRKASLITPELPK